MSAMLELLGHLCRERVLVKVAASAAGAAGTQLPTPPQQQQQVSGTVRRLQALRGSSGGPSMSSAALPKAPYAQQRQRPAATTGTKLSPNTARAGLLGGGLGAAIMSGAIQPPGGWSYRRRRLANALSRGAGLFNNLGNIGSAAYGAFMR